MYNEQIEQLINAALADGVLTEKEKQILFKKAQSMGIDLDEFEMVLDARLVELAKAEKAKADASAPKSNKLGDVKKCPACGAIVQSYQGVCPECGYAFEGTDANSAVKELSSLLQKVSDYDKMGKIIDNFPIPLEKTALLSFVTWLRPQSTDIKNPLSNSYYKKYVECVNKIKVSFSNDKELSPFIDYLTQDEKKIRNQKITKLTLKNKWFWIVLAVLIIIGLIIKPKPLNKDSEKSRVAITEAIAKGDLEKAQKILMDYTGNNKGTVHELALNIVEKYLEQDNIASAITLAHFVGVPCNGSCYSFVATIQHTISNYYADHKKYDEAIAFEDDGIDPGVLEKIVKNLCKEGNKKDARKYVNQYYDKIVIYGEASTREKWKKKQLSIINEY